MGRNARIGLFVMLLSLISIPFGSNQAVSVCPSGEPYIYITIAQPNQTAYVAPGQDGIVTFTGVVGMGLPWPEGSKGVKVHLLPDAGDWFVVPPPELFFSRAERIKRFSLEVHVPIGTSISCKGQLSVGGTWEHLNTTKGGTIPMATAIIVVEQYKFIKMDSPERFIRIERGQSLRTQVKVENQGNGDERLKARINNRNELESRGWKIDLAPEKIAVEEGNSTMLDLEMTSSDDMETGFYNLSIGIAVAGAQCEDPYFFDHTLFIEVHEKEVFGIELRFWLIFDLSMMILMGMVASFLVSIRKRKKHLPIRIS
ncbi:MAG: choice-of-anchor T family protein [Thermoplasmatota archaeon]